jgi:hypothetical protein
MLFTEITAVYCENHTRHINTLCWKNTNIVKVSADVRVYLISYSVCNNIKTLKRTGYSFRAFFWLPANLNKHHQTVNSCMSLYCKGRVHRSLPIHSVILKQGAPETIATSATFACLDVSVSHPWLPSWQPSTVYFPNLLVSKSDFTNRL